jgi:glycosyltransferase involved in cell wall biosynthesis
VWRVGNALLPCFFAPRRQVLETKGPPLLLNVGTIAAHKGQLELLEWASTLHRKGLRFELCFVGAADRGSAYVRDFLGRLEEKQREGHVRYLDWCAPEAMVELMDRAQALVHTPTEESFGLVVAEALARELKLFAFGPGGVADVATGVGDATLVPTGDWAGLGEAVSAWLREGCPRSGGSSERMAARFHPQVIGRRYCEVYRELLAGAAVKK